MIATTSAYTETTTPYSGCDECEHPSPAHLQGWADDLMHTPTADFIFEHSTCWAESICAICDPTNYQVACEMAAEWIELHR